MRLARGLTDLGLGLERAAVTVGNFDGVHRGHQAVIDAARAAAASRRSASVVCTFHPHTALVLRPGRAPAMLQTLQQRLSCLEATGVDVVVVIPFDQVVAATDRARFVEDFLVGELSVGSLHVSKGFAFGRGGNGRTEYLEERGVELGFDVSRVPPVIVDAAPVSSTRIRKALRAGEVESAATMLGRPYAVSGRVVHGAGRGRQIGIPTANLASGTPCLAATGVYAGAVRHGTDRFPAVVNVGTRPTFEASDDLTVEAHVLDASPDLYDVEVEVALESRLRAERRFADAEALRTAIAADIAAARRWASGRVDAGVV